MSSGPLAPAGANFVPGRYRGVAVARPGCGLDLASLRDHFVGLEAYRRTRFVVVRDGAATAVLRVRKESEEPLFSPITGVELLAGPAECAFVVEPAADTAIPSELAEVAARRAPQARAVVVQGRYEHVNFILDPKPLVIRLRDVAPPWPPKLLDQTRRIIASTEDLPPIRLVPEIVELDKLAAEHRAGHYLMPCRGGGAEIAGAQMSYLDERPEDSDWLLLGCARSQQIHQWFYDRSAPSVNICPLQTADQDRPEGELLLTKCCLQEQGIEHGEGWTSVPWGSSLDQVREALYALARNQEAPWAPA